MDRDLDFLEGSVVQHFKGNYYYVIAVGKYTETEECMVVYRAMYPPYQIWIRPYDMFVSEVDHKKYPDVRQKYRFEIVDNYDFKSIVPYELDYRLGYDYTSLESLHEFGGDAIIDFIKEENLGAYGNVDIDDIIDTITQKLRVRTCENNENIALPLSFSQTDSCIKNFNLDLWNALNNTRFHSVEVF